MAAGANSAVPHHRPTDAVLAAGDFVKLDFGALVGGYHSDMTRTYVLGQRRRLAARSVRAGAQRRSAPDVRRCARVRSAPRSTPRRAVSSRTPGYGELFLHGLGHGVGLEIHEAPGIGAAGTGTLARAVRR